MSPIYINIFGASGSGTSTLGQALSDRFGWRHLDADAYYWKKTTPPFQEKIPLKERNAALQHDVETGASFTLSGSMISWGDYWRQAFNLGVFLHIPPEIRMNRLRARELQRYGALLEHDPVCAANSKAFLEWARQYDNPAFDGKSISLHQRWISLLNCPVLRIDGDTTVAERITLVEQALIKKGLMNPP